MVAADPEVVLPPTQMRWSVNNRAVSGNREIGEIGTSSYVTQGDDRAVYVLGDAGRDTDEFDSSVVIHEWGHYFEDQVSRSDSIGGPHSLASRLDPRVALGEGFGNALSGIVQGDPLYRDSFGERDAQGFSFSLEASPQDGGWFSEFSVQSILYDIADSNSDTGDQLSEGFAPIYGALTDPDYLADPGYLSIFTFADAMRRTSPGLTGGIDTLLQREDIAVTDAFGTGEDNDGGVDEALPIYLALPLDGTAVEFCSVPTEEGYNRIGNRQFFRLEVPSAQTVDFTLTNTLRPAGEARSDPDFFINRQGALVARAISGDADVETASVQLEAGTYVIDAHEFVNVDRGRSGQGRYCMNFTAQ